MFWDNKNTSFIDNTMITYNQSRASLGSSSPSSKCSSNKLLLPTLFLGSIMILWWMKEGKLGNSKAILAKGLQIFGARMGCETRWVSLFLCLDVEWDPNNSFYMTKVWLFGWMTGYKQWISWETTQNPINSTNPLQLFIFWNFC